MRLRFLLLLACSAAAPLAAQGRPLAGWQLSVRAEELRIGDYLDHGSEETFVQGTFAVHTTTRHTGLRLDPMRGARATLSRIPAASSWGVRAELGWARGGYVVDLSRSVRSQYGSDPSVTSSDEQRAWDRASAWEASVGIVRRLGSTASRLQGALTVQPMLTVLRVPFVSDPPVAATPPLGYYGPSLMIYPPARIHNYMSPGAKGGGTHAANHGRGVALELGVSASMLRSAGDALARDLGNMPSFGNRPGAHGVAQWRPAFSYGIGLSYLP